MHRSSRRSPTHGALAMDEAELSRWGRRVRARRASAARRHARRRPRRGEDDARAGDLRGLRRDRARSPVPTFALVHEYEAPRSPVYHLDLYRLERPDAARRNSAGTRSSARDALVLVEWPERAGDRLPGGHVTLVAAAPAGRSRASPAATPGGMHDHPRPRGVDLRGKRRPSSTARACVAERAVAMRGREHESADARGGRRARRRGRRDRERSSASCAAPGRAASRACASPARSRRGSRSRRCARSFRSRRSRWSSRRASRSRRAATSPRSTRCAASTTSRCSRSGTRAPYGALGPERRVPSARCRSWRPRTTRVRGGARSRRRRARRSARRRGAPGSPTSLDATPAADLAAWEPTYGRLAEAQVKWEATHGRSLEAV